MAAEAGTYATEAGLLDLWIRVEVRAGRVVEVALEEDRPGRAEEDHELLEQVQEHLLTGAESFEGVEVDLSDLTGFQRSVLEALRAVPAGETVTYGELAERIGRPDAARAVGNAVAENPFPIVVPCHRVTRSDGLGAYSGGRGEETKRRLLKVEGVL